MIQISIQSIDKALILLIERVKAGESIILLDGDQPVARIVKEAETPQSAAVALADTFFALRAGTRLEGLDWKSLRDLGRP